MKFEIINPEHQLTPQISKEDRAKGADILYFLLENWKKLIHFYTKGSRNTRETYLHNCKHFIEFIRENGVTPNVVNDFALSMQEEGVKLATRKARGTIAKNLLYWTHKQDITLINKEMYHNFVDDVKFHTAQEKQPQKERSNTGVIDKIEAVIAQIDDPKKHMNIQTQFTIFKYCGLRVSELIRLKGNDFDFAELKVTVKRKGGVVSSTDIFTLVAEQVKRHMRFFNLDAKDYLFTSRSGEPLSRFQLRYRWDKIFGQAGVKISLHDLRHYAASYLAELTNGNPYVISGVLGHSNITTSQRYVSAWAKKNKLKEIDSQLLRNARKTL